LFESVVELGFGKVVVRFLLLLLNVITGLFGQFDLTSLFAVSLRVDFEFLRARSYDEGEAKFCGLVGLGPPVVSLVPVVPGGSFGYGCLCLSGYLTGGALFPLFSC